MAFTKGRRRSYKQAAAENQGDDADEDEELDVDEQLNRVVEKSQASGQGIKIKIVNGEHIIDEQSQRIDRHALANEDLDNLEEFEDDDLTRRFNSHTYIHMKRREPEERIPSTDKWSSADTQKFYDCLSKFGTDFMTISKMFKGRNRRHIKSKFTREEKLFPDRIHRALVGDEVQVWDLEMFKRETGLEESDFQNPEDVAEELRLRREQREAEIEEARRETEETKRQRRLAGVVSDDEREEVVAL